MRPSLPAVFILLDKVIFHHLPFTRRRGWVCYSSIPSVCQFLCGWLCFSREDRVDLMCSASRTSPGLARQEEVLLQAAAVGRRWVGSGTAALTHSSAIKEVCVKICPVSFLWRGERKKQHMEACWNDDVPFFRSGPPWPWKSNLKVTSERDEEFIS